MKFLNKLSWYFLLFIIVFGAVFYYSGAYETISPKIVKDLNIKKSPRSTEEMNDSLDQLIDSLHIRKSQLKTAVKIHHYEKKRMNTLKKEIPESR